MPFAYAGKCLDIDLNGGTITKTPISPGHVEKYIGGRGVATRMFVDRVSPETDPFSPDNPLIFAAGLLTGTPAPAANRTALVTRSPQTGLLTYSTIGGFWGAELKRAGYDTLTIHGIADKPVYLFIRDDLVELRDASHLWGQTVCTTRRMLAKDHHPDTVQILCIGPAGEQKVYAATIEHTMGSGAHRAGVGAVMGHKGLKAIVVRGTQDIYVAHPAAFQATCETILSKTGPIRQYWDNWPAQNGSWLYKEAMHGNYEDTVVLENDVDTLTDFETAHKSGTAACLNCGAPCKSTIRLPEGQYACVKCQSFFNFMFALKIDDVHFSVGCFRRCEDYGLDVISTAYLTAFAIDLYEKGIITRADTGGFP